jgi:hypothetical protein
VALGKEVDILVNQVKGVKWGAVENWLLKASRRLFRKDPQSPRIETGLSSQLSSRASWKVAPCSIAVLEVDDS